MKNNEDEVVPVGQSLFYSWRSAPGASILPSAARCATDAPEALKGENAQKIPEVFEGLANSSPGGKDNQEMTAWRAIMKGLQYTPLQTLWKMVKICKDPFSGIDSALEVKTNLYYIKIY